MTEILALLKSEILKFWWLIPFLPVFLWTYQAQDSEDFDGPSPSGESSSDGRVKKCERVKIRWCFLVIIFLVFVVLVIGLSHCVNIQFQWR